MDSNWRKLFSDLYSDAGSFHPSLWEEERRAKQRIHFDFDDEETDEVNISAKILKSADLCSVLSPRVRFVIHDPYVFTGKTWKAANPVSEGNETQNTTHEEPGA